MITALGKILLGTSGWDYKDWIGPFYKTEDERKLYSYSKIFKTAEIDSTFYAYPSQGTVMGWLRYTPKDFIFTAKLPQIITHEKMLNLQFGVEEDLKNFCKLMKPLNDEGKLGCLLIQMPPTFKINLDLLENFFKILPEEFRFAIEFRNITWMTIETWKLLKKYNVAYTIVDEPLLPPEVHITADFAYFRWHGRGRRPWYNYMYKVEELEFWVPRVKEVSSKTENVFGYFNNHYHGYAVENCLQILEMLGVLTPEQAEAKKKVEEYLFETSKTIPIQNLTSFIKPEAEKMGFEQLLNEFIDKVRLKRAKGIKDDEVKILEANQNKVEANLKDYKILIDLEKRIILHNCADWSRCITTKRFCKHLGKLMLSIPEDLRLKILRKIYSEKEVWEFKPYV